LGILAGTGRGKCEPFENNGNQQGTQTASSSIMHNDTHIDGRKVSWVALVLFQLASVATLSSFAQSNQRVALPGHVPAAVRRMRPQATLPGDAKLDLALGLPLRNRAELTQLLRELQDPYSPGYHHYLTPQEFAARFGPTEEQYQQVVAFARKSGFAIVAQHPNRVVLDVEGSVRAIEQAFQVHLYQFRHPDEARSFYAPDTDPSVPAGLRVETVEGLNNFRLPRPLLHLAERVAPQPLTGSGPSGYYAGNDFRNAYVPGTSLTGAGQVVGLFEFTGYYGQDITNYENTIGMTHYVPLVNVVIGHPAPTTANNIEAALDIEVAIAMAPGLSQIIVYESSGNPSSILSKMANDNLAKQLSSSWSWGGGPSSTIDSLFQQMASQGQSFFQASGDSDAYTGGNLLDNANAAVAPVDSPYLTSVGGTTLTMSGAGSLWAGETVWNWHGYGGTYASTGSSGGSSSYYSLPYWQTNVTMGANSGSTTWRNIPDVALTADNVYVAYNNGSSGGVGGTSCAAPLWAGFCALANELAASSGAPPMGFLNPTLYALANSTNYSVCFHDITSGNNVGTNTPGLYNAVSGYDLCTGLGTPNGPNLLSALIPSPQLLSEPASQTVTNGSTVQFSVTALGQAPLHYQWQYEGTSLSAGAGVTGVNSNVLSLSSVLPANSGNYDVVVTNLYGAVTSSVAVLSVGLAPSLSTQPTNVTVLSGGTANFSVLANGSAPLAYQWWHNGVAILNGPGVSGATTNTLTLMNVTTNSAGGYLLIVTNSFGSLSSSQANLSVVLPPSLSGVLTNYTVQCGSNLVSFSVTAAGTPPLDYQWNLDGTPLPGATSSALSLTNLHLPNHTVAVLVTNLYGSASSNALITVRDTLPPMITLNGTNLMFLAVGSAFTDPGATALDLCMGVVPVNVTGTVNTSSAGTNLLTYSATDGNGNIATAQRTVIVQSSNAPATLSILLSTNQTVLLQLSGGAGATYVLQASTNLVSVSWQSLATNSFGTNGTATFNDPWAGNAQRFYRLSLPQ
jgi:hypothetical protein